MLQEAKEYLVTGAPPGSVVLAQARVEDATLIVHGDFDAIWFSAVLLHVPRRTAGKALGVLRTLLAESGVLYVSTRLACADDGHAIPSLEIRREGRVFVYYQESELEAMFRDASLQILKSWRRHTIGGMHGERQSKSWCHYLLKRAR